MLIDQIKADALQARRSKSPSASVLVTLLGEAGNAEKTFNPARPLTDAEVVAIVRKFLKNIGDTISNIGNLPADRQEAERAKLQAEQATLEGYLPQQLGTDQLEAIARERAAAGEQMGQIMAYLKANYAGKYDGKTASAIVKAALQ